MNSDLRESMTEADIEIILERAKELHPEARPPIISDNGPQFRHQYGVPAERRVSAGYRVYEIVRFAWVYT